MKKGNIRIKARIASIFLAACLLAGCDLSQFRITNTNVDPKSAETCVFGVVLDRFNQPLPGARVTNYADVFDTLSEEKAVYLGNENGGYVNLPPGYFVLQHIPVGDNNKGSTSIVATYDGISSSVIPVQIEKKSTNFRLTAGSSKNYSLLDENGDLDTDKLDKLPSLYNLNLVAVTSGNYDHAVTIPIDGPVGDTGRNCLRSLGGQGDNGIIAQAPSVTAEVATDSVMAYTPTDGIVKLVLQAPPGSSGATIAAYTIEYINTSTNTALFTPKSQKTISPPIVVMPALANQSGPKAYIPIDTAANAKWPIEMRDRNIGTSAKITFYSSDTFSDASRIQQFVTKPIPLTVDIILKIKR